MADTAADVEMDTGDKAAVQQDSVEAAADAAGAHVAQNAGVGQPPTSLHTKLHALAAEPVVQSGAEISRGAGTPAGPQEEFYSPQEHFLNDSAEQPNSLVQDIEISKMKDTDAAAQQPAQGHATAQAEPDRNQPGMVEGGQAVEQEQPVQEVLQPAVEIKAPLETKTPANVKRRKGNNRCQCCWCLCFM